MKLALIDHMTINGLHLELHSAYKKHHSTESALLKVKNDSKVTLLALLDLSAAFDTVRHDILLDRLRSNNNNNNNNNNNEYLYRIALQCKSTVIKGVLS